jgi:hypothetical protein
MNASSVLGFQEYTSSTTRDEGSRRYAGSNIARISAYPMPWSCQKARWVGNMKWLVFVDGLESPYRPIF